MNMAHFIQFGFIILVIALVHGKFVRFDGANAAEESNLFEADIKLTDRDKVLLDGDIQGDAIIGSSYKWPSTRIPYTIRGMNTQGRNAITAAIDEYKKKTCLTFHQRSTERDYIEIFASGGCWSYVGKQGGKQQISIGRGCEYRSTVVHELLHALGFWHEQSREDRDQYIKINTENIMTDMAHNFNKHKSTSYNHPYDFDSVMHYSNRAFSKNGKQTITAFNNHTRNFGQPANGGLSAIDAAQLNAHYCVSRPVTTTTTKRSSTTSSTKTTDSTRCDMTGVGCRDKYAYCGLLARKGYCNMCEVKQSCSLSCNGPDRKWECKIWAQKGFCLGQYQRYMTGNCPVSCGTTVCQ